MKYIPQSPDDRADLLKAIGVESTEDLFSTIPKSLLVKDDLAYPKAQSEIEIRNSFQKIGEASKHPRLSFAGCGIYQHDIPSVVPFIQSRSEFATAYTPYQPEISQGLLQCIFEFQTLACQLTESELSNASLYDGATALGEALLMGLRILKKSSGKILISPLLHPFYRDVVNTYAEHFQSRFDSLPITGNRIDLDQLEKQAAEGGVDIIITQSPNIFGCLENDARLGEIIRKYKIFWISSTMEPLVWGLLRGQGYHGADVVTGEGQSFGNAPYLAGSSYGFFCSKQEYLRNLPGRLVGETLDEDKKRSYVLTFATREQFIRRGRATSNICTNNNLNMLAGLFHLVTLGKRGIRKLAEQNLAKTEFLKSELLKITKFKISEEPTFNEFTLETNEPASKLMEKALAKSIIAGVDLGRFKEEWKHKLLIHVSELHSKQDLMELAKTLSS